MSDLKFQDIQFTNERLEVAFKGKTYPAFGTTDPNVVFIPTIGKFVNKHKSVDEEKDPKDIFLEQNGAHSWVWRSVLVSLPTNDNDVFYLDFDTLGSKQYVSANKRDKLIQWMKLTEELFL